MYGPSMTTALLTGATGTMGRATLREMLAEGLCVRAFVLPGEELPEEFRGVPHLTVVEGDLTDAAAARDAVAGIDVVLNVAALVSPLADDRPDLARAVNVRGTENLLDAIRHHGGRARFVGIGSVAETGDRPAPIHWGRVGDPLAPAEAGAYALSKVEAERRVVDSGLERWLWLRQTGVLHAGLATVRDPIMTHPPLDEVLEWVSDRDSGRLLARIAAGRMPEHGWNDVHNIGGGQGWRHTNAAIFVKMGRALRVRNMLAWYERRWFATRGFHGQWYTDSDRLEELVPFREDTFDGALERIVAEGPWSLRLSCLLPAALVRHLVTGPQVRAERGTIHAIENDLDREIELYYGSRASFEAIGGWDEYTPARPSRTPSFLDHGYDEAVAPEAWDEALVQGAADFRGGALRGRFTPGAPRRVARWACADGHEFDASPWAVLRAGHWCPVCITEPLDFPRQARANRFLAQVVPGEG